MASEQTTTFLVFFTLAVFNFASSIIQSVAGIGDALLMHVLWLLACTLSDDFNRTPLGNSPVRAVALIMYIRLFFLSPLVVYLGLNDSVFSMQMTIMMAVPSAILTMIGVILYTKLDTSSLEKILGFTCFLFALMYMGIIVYRAWRKRRQMEELKARNVKLVVEFDAVEKEARPNRMTNLAALHANFMLTVSNNSPSSMRPPPPSGQGSFMLRAPDPSIQGDSVVGMPGSTIIADGVSARGKDARTGLPADTTDAFLSTISGEVFVAHETQLSYVNEENVPPLTPSKISPSRTMTFTRVRINRNIDANGKIKMSTKIGAAVAASLAGFMASLTGVNAPPQIIFILLFDAPNYIVRVNLSAQSIPGNIIRFIMAVWNGSFNQAMIPLMIVVVVFGFAGVFVGNHIGRLLGPQSFNVFVVCLLLLCSLAMVGEWQTLLTICTILTGIITVGCGYFENKSNKPIIERQLLSELKVEKRMYNCLEELKRNSSSVVQQPLPPTSASNFQEHLQRQNRPKPLWEGMSFDNDDEGAGDEREKKVRSSSSSAAAAAAAALANEAKNAPSPASTARDPRNDRNDNESLSLRQALLENDESIVSVVDECDPRCLSPSLRSMNSTA
ncbi:hypothetical protein JKF63_02180 [Porcisia hertigi]|uniref:Uncharacterized protein n=1 Tax=Porcisia hertigi TaxID=2761500 RepID=A0A836L2T2_9TRYP|nr:hypothetical protein JKF63_02180 [Porcisia hertigi]